MAIAAKYAKVSKYTPATSNRVVQESKVASIFGEMEAKGTMKNVGGRPVRGMTKKGWRKRRSRVLEDHKVTPTAAETHEAHMAENKRRLRSRA